MQVDDKLILFLEDLSSLTLPDGERTRLAADLQKILDGVSGLINLNTDGLPAEIPYNNSNVFREDEALPSFDRELILKNAPVKNDEYFIAPKTVE